MFRGFDILGRRVGWAWAALWVAAMGGVAWGEGVGEFGGGVRPLLQTYCFKCHNASRQKGHVNFAILEDEGSAVRQRKLWRKSFDELAGKEMPPDDEEKQPTEAERATLMNWMKWAGTQGGGASGEADPGPALIRRLSWTEYDNSVRDLLGVEFDSAALVGATEEAGAGNTFGNLAAALDIAPAQIEKYFTAADKVLDRFFETDPSSSFDGAMRDRARGTREALFGVEHDSWKTPSDAPKLPEGRSEREVAKGIITSVLTRAYRRPASERDVAAMMGLYEHAMGKKAGLVNSVRLVLKAILVSPKFLYRIEREGSDGSGSAGSGKARRVDDYDLAARLSFFLWSSGPDEELMALAGKGVLGSGKVGAEPVRLSGRIMGSANQKNHENLVEAAFDGDPYTFYEGPDGDGDWVGLDLGEARKLTRIGYAGVHYEPGRLQRGRFQGSSTADFSNGVVDLFTVEKAPKRGEITRHEIAGGPTFRYVRFLSAPGGRCSLAEMQLWGIDDSGASAGKTVLEQQVERLLMSPRAAALTKNFGARWLELNKLASARPSTEFFPDFQPVIREAMYGETFAFFDHLRSDDRSVLDLLEANYTYLNQALAEYYHIPGVSGEEIRRVELKPEYHRGGLLGMGSVLAVTSHTYRTSPTLRGKYVLDVIFGTPPPPPPANAGMFKDEGKVKEAKSFRELLASHASDPSCAVCHKKLDPLGFSLENFNAAGVWQDDDHGRALDNQGVLPTGEKLVGVEGLKKVVMGRKDDFVRNMTEQLMIYALGRDLDDYDEETVKSICLDLAKHDYRFSRLVMDVVKSYPFEYRRAMETVSGAGK